MTVSMHVLTYADVIGLVGHQVAVSQHAGVELTVECVSTPETFAGLTSYSIRLTGPTGHPLPAGTHVLHAGGRSFELDLDAVARDLRYLHYEAFRVELRETAAHVA